jgi:hypothetical protein
MTLQPCENYFNKEWRITEPKLDLKTCKSGKCGQTAEFQFKYNENLSFYHLFYYRLIDCTIFTMYGLPYGLIGGSRRSESQEYFVKIG